MGILGQILKLTAISIFFSATATIYIVDSEVYQNFLDKLNPQTTANLTSDESDKMSKEELKSYREYLRKSEIDKTGSKKSRNNSKTKSIWQNNYNN